MEIITIIILGLVLYTIWKLGKLDTKLDIGVDNPYYDNKISMPLSKYEKELDKVFDYDNIKTTPLNNDLPILLTKEEVENFNDID